MIQIRDLTFTYSGSPEPAIQALSFEVGQGEIFGFLGPSGAGKSTTQKILIGILQGYSGAASIFGKDLAGRDSDYYERIGVSFEYPNHYLKLTAIENLTYFASLYSRETRSPQELLEMVGLGGDGDMLVSQYSKGMKNRLSFSRSLLHNPELLFLDEPTAGLDPLNARRIKDLIQAQKLQGKTVFLTTHDMSAADELCDRLAFIVEGRIELIESPRDLKLRYGQARIRIEYGPDDRTEACEFPLENLGSNVDFLELLQTQKTRTLHTLEASLEDVFIEVTGRQLT